MEATRGKFGMDFAGDYAGKYSGLFEKQGKPIDVHIIQFESGNDIKPGPKL
jgi:hypothetical protein